jgi:hypothetical protein
MSGHYVRIVACSPGATKEMTAPYFWETATPERNLQIGLDLLHAAGRQKPDLALLPETFIQGGLTPEQRAGTIQGWDGEHLAQVGDLARQYRMNVLGGFVVRDGNVTTNRAVLFDRDGNIAGSYGKRYPTEGEISNYGVSPDSGPIVLQADFGRIGAAICFDVNWPHIWQEMKANGADLICWLSAYGGGFPLNSLAWTCGLPIVTSVRPNHSVHIGRTGHTLGTTARGNPIGVFDINLSQKMYHTDFNMKKVVDIYRKYGDGVRVQSYTEEHIFTLETTNENLDIEDIEAEFGLVRFDDYIRRCEIACDEARLPAS